jgi:hypothetical protein
MDKLQAELAVLAARAKLLDSKRAATQTALDRAVEARQRNLIEGDLENAQAAAKLQAMVDSAGSTLAGYDTAISALAASIVAVEAKLGAEQLAADRKQASDTLIAQTDVIAKQIGPWLALTRDLAASTAAVGISSFESDQIAGYLRNCASEIEAAGIATIGSLRSYAAGIITGQFPIPRAPGAIPAKAPAPAPTTARVYLTASVAWYDDKGAKFRAPAMNDCDLPLTLLAKGKGIGAVHELNSDVRKKSHGSKTSAPPEWAHCKWLNDDPKAKTDVEPILHSAFEKHPNVGRPYSGTMRQPAQPQTATRSLPPGKK